MLTNKDIIKFIIMLMVIAFILGGAIVYAIL